MRTICGCKPHTRQVGIQSQSAHTAGIRRQGLGVVWAAALIWLFGAAQPLAAGTARIGILSYWSCDPAAYQNEFDSFLHGLTELGYKQGRTFTIECRGADKDYNKLRKAADELVRIPVDVIVTNSQPAGRAAHDATDKIPIVSVVSGDPISAGLVRSLARPGGNFTGVSYYVTELTAKRMELLTEAIPGIKKIGVLANPD